MKKYNSKVLIWQIFLWKVASLPHAVTVATLKDMLFNWMATYVIKGLFNDLDVYFNWN